MSYQTARYAVANMTDLDSREEKEKEMSIIVSEKPSKLYPNLYENVDHRESPEETYITIEWIKQKKNLNKKYILVLGDVTLTSHDSMKKIFNTIYDDYTVGHVQYHSTTVKQVDSVYAMDHKSLIAQCALNATFDYISSQIAEKLTSCEELRMGLEDVELTLIGFSCGANIAQHLVTNNLGIGVKNLFMISPYISDGFYKHYRHRLLGCRIFYNTHSDLQSTMDAVEDMFTNTTHFRHIYRFNIADKTEFYIHVRDLIFTDVQSKNIKGPLLDKPFYKASSCIIM